MRATALHLLLSANSWASDDVAQIDVRIIIGGNFSIDHLGPAWYRAVVMRVLDRPGKYLDVLERRILPRIDDEGVAALWVSNLLRLTRAEEPERAFRIATDMRQRAADALLRCAHRRTPKSGDLVQQMFKLQTRYAEYDALTR
jgi:hypothetical protein